MITGWYFFSGSLQDSHLNDIKIGIHAAIHSQFDPKNIHVFLPLKEAADLNQLQTIFSNINLHDVDNFESIIENHVIERLFVVVTGHGSPNGISISLDPAKYISPTNFVSVLSKITNLNQCIIVLGQCFSGIFNYIDLPTTPSFAILGATNLDSSLNDEASEDLKLYVNVYLFYFFYWFFDPVDIDGDGKFSVLYAYKYAGCMTVKKLHAFRYKMYTDIDCIKDAIDKIKRSKTKDSFSEEALRSKIRKNLEYIHSIQTPWISNHILAQQVIIPRTP